MTETHKKSPDAPVEPTRDDRVTRFVRDLATAAPPKSFDMVKAATDVVEKAEAGHDREARDARIRDRAYHLWVQDGRPHDKHEDYWLAAEAELGRRPSDHH